MASSTERLATDVEELARLMANNTLRVEDLRESAIVCREAAWRLRELALVIRRASQLVSSADGAVGIMLMGEGPGASR